MIQWIYTDSPEEQNESVTNKRNFYIGGSELNKIFEDFYKGDIIQNIFEKLCYIDTSHNVQPDWATFGHKAEEIIRDYVNRKFKRNYRPAVSIMNLNNQELMLMVMMKMLKNRFGNVKHIQVKKI